MTTPAQPTEELQKHAAVLSEQVYGTEFFNKLASLGVTPRNEPEASQLLQLAITIDEAGWQPAKTAAAAENPFLSACLNDLQQQNAVRMAPAILKQASLKAVLANKELRAAALAVHQARQPAA